MRRYRYSKKIYPLMEEYSVREGWQYVVVGILLVVGLAIAVII